MDESIGEGDISKNPMPLGVGVSEVRTYHLTVIRKEDLSERL